MLMIRLARFGAKKKPSYRVVVIEKERARDSRSVEVVGTYNPVAGLADAVILLGFTLLDVVLVVSARQLELRKRGHV